MMEKMQADSLAELVKLCEKAQEPASEAAAGIKSIGRNWSPLLNPYAILISEENVYQSIGCSQVRSVPSCL